MQFLYIFIVCGLFLSDKTRHIEYNGKKVKTTYDAPSEFYGIYQGRKEGYLKLNEDGSGEYHYDVFGFAPTSCKPGVIPIEWGFLLDEKDSLVSFSREYGLSYPILMQSTGETKFQGCRKQVMLDFIMKYNHGGLGVSSSDDWIKN